MAVIQTAPRRSTTVHFYIPVIHKDPFNIFHWYTLIHKDPQRSTNTHTDPQRSIRIHKDPQTAPLRSSNFFHRSTAFHKDPLFTKIHEYPQRIQRSTNKHKDPPSHKDPQICTKKHKSFVWSLPAGTPPHRITTYTRRIKTGEVISLQKIHRTNSLQGVQDHTTSCLGHRVTSYRRVDGEAFVDNVSPILRNSSRKLT